MGPENKAQFFANTDSFYLNMNMFQVQFFPSGDNFKAQFFCERGQIEGKVFSVNVDNF